MYLLTPNGVAAKARLTVEYLRRKMEEYLISLKVVGFCFKDFSKIGILLDPISKSPGGKAEIPVSINFVDMPDLIVVKVKVSFDFIAIMLFDEVATHLV